ncbi:2,3-bisphosphoglycerate-independent phosphoglycerate mutase [Pseudomonadota bacterium]
MNTPSRRPTLLVILDGFGINPSNINNGVAAANTPKLDEYFAQYPLTKLHASGKAVGLPDGQMGNSEVGHLTMGSGAVMRQDLVRIDDAIEDGSFYLDETLLSAVNKAKQKNSPLHLIGLVSLGGVHSHMRHLDALIDLCKQHSVKPLLHMITDGRDTPPQSAIEYVAAIDSKLATANGAVATVSGRYYAMDRDKRWDRTELAWRAMVNQQGLRASNLKEAVEQAYGNEVTDEFIRPTVLPDSVKLNKDDAVVFFNFRKDRTRQLTAALTKQTFEEFDRGDFQPLRVTCMTNYDSYFDLPFIFKEERPETTLAETIYNAGLSQFHCAETEKYAHVTYFFNGGVGDPYPNEDRLIVSSPKVATYDEQPEMSAHDVADSVIEAMEHERYGFIVVNFANGDMVGHTAIRDAVIKAIEALDYEVGRVLDSAVKAEYSIIVTADHGNCEQLVDPSTGKPHTQHTTNPVPCLIIDQVKWQLAPEGGLMDIAPTVLQLMGVPQPGTMTGHSLLVKPVDSNSEAA